MIFVYRFQASRCDQNHREKSCYVASELIALSLLVGIVKILIFITVDIFKHTAKKKNKKIKRADQILPEVYGTTLNSFFSFANTK